MSGAAFVTRPGAGGGVVRELGKEAECCFFDKKVAFDVKECIQFEPFV